MKCICGFSEDKEETKIEHSKFGENKFIHIQGTFLAEVKGSYYMQEKRVYLYACPSCNTVRMYD